jgi:hypothetical protein
MNPAAFPKFGVGGAFGAFIGYHGGQILNILAQIPAEVSGDVTNVCMALLALAGGLVGHWMHKRGIDLADNSTTKGQP